MPQIRSSESRAEEVARELLTIRGWNIARPPRGNVLWKNEYRDYPHLRTALEGRGKAGKGGDAYPDFLVVNPSGMQPLIVGETKAQGKDIGVAISEAELYGEAFLESGLNVLSAGIAGNETSNIEVRVNKRSLRAWKPVAYRNNPIQWIPTPDETSRLLTDNNLFELQPRVPSNEILAKRGDEINRILRECNIKDEFRPAIVGAFMLALWHSAGLIRTDDKHVLSDINAECVKAFVGAGKQELANSILVQEANAKLASRAVHICRILRLLNITTLTAEHDYIGQLYEMFFRFTGGNTIGQFFTPRHVTRFMVDFIEVSKKDVVVDPTCGTGGFLISSLNRMTEGKALTKAEINNVVRDHLIGFENEPITAALCVANMILRGDGTTGIVKGDCFVDDQYPEGKASVVLGNPPFPHKQTDDPAEKFVERGLEALRPRGLLAMIVPISVITKSSTSKANWRRRILRENTLKAVITLPSELFQPYASSTTAIIVLQRGIPHARDSRTFFCRIENDGLKIKKNVRIERAGDQLPKALDAWKAGMSIAGFCATTIVPDLTSGSEWAPGAYIEYLHHSTRVLEKEIDILVQQLGAFQVLHAHELARLDGVMAGGKLHISDYRKTRRMQSALDDVKPGTIGALFDIFYGQKALHNKENLQPGESLIISSAGSDNGCYGFFKYDDLIAPPFVSVPSTGSIGEACVQERPCGVTDDCLLLIPKPETTPEYLFLVAAVIRLERWRFDYGRKITPERIKDVHIPDIRPLIDRIKARRSTIARYTGQIIDRFSDDAQETLSHETGDRLCREFGRLAEKWYAETGALSLMEQKAVHQAYQRIIGMGPAALPFIFEELQRSGGHWMWALRAITGLDAAKGETQFTMAVAKWLTWGKNNGYLG